MVASQSMRHPRAAVVRAHIETRMTELRHHRQRIGRHAALAVRKVLGVGCRSRRVAVAAQVDGDDLEPRRQGVGHAVPHRVA